MGRLDRVIIYLVPHMRTFADRAQTPKPPNTPKPQLRPTEHQAMWPDESASSLPRRQVELQESAKDRTFYMQKVEQVRSHCLSMCFPLPHCILTAFPCALTAFPCVFSLPLIAFSPRLRLRLHCRPSSSGRGPSGSAPRGWCRPRCARAAPKERHM